LANRLPDARYILDCLKYGSGAELFEVRQQAAKMIERGLEFEAVVLQFAKDLAVNRSGGDNPNLGDGKSVGAYLDELIARSKAT